MHEAALIKVSAAFLTFFKRLLWPSILKSELKMFEKFNIIHWHPVYVCDCVWMVYLWFKLIMCEMRPAVSIQAPVFHSVPQPRRPFSQHTAQLRPRPARTHTPASACSQKRSTYIHTCGIFTEVHFKYVILYKNIC